MAKVRFSIQEERDPVAPREGEATVAIEMTGICGSDREWTTETAKRHAQTVY
jgi:threonine dehydrogenase-like Zn-dependent dehydrogenase